MTCIFPFQREASKLVARIKARSNLAKGWMKRRCWKIAARIERRNARVTGKQRRRRRSQILDHPVAEKWGRLVNRRVLSGCTERADGQYGTTCPSQRNRDTLSKAGESAWRAALKAHFPRTRCSFLRRARDTEFNDGGSSTALNGPFS